jgi:hypothetical protein
MRGKETRRSAFPGNTKQVVIETSQWTEEATMSDLFMNKNSSIKGENGADTWGHLDKRMTK